MGFIQPGEVIYGCLVHAVRIEANASAWKAFDVKIMLAMEESCHFTLKEGKVEVQSVN